MVLDHTAKTEIGRDSGNSRGERVQLKSGEQEAETPQDPCVAFPGSRFSTGAVQGLPVFCFSEVHKSLHHIYEWEKNFFLTSK